MSKYSMPNIGNSFQKPRIQRKKHFCNNKNELKRALQLYKL